jgi:hypothetical protein
MNRPIGLTGVARAGHDVEVTQLRTHEDLLQALRRVEGLAEKGKNPGHFYRRSVAFLHFHGTDADRYADVRVGPDWVRMAADTPQARAVLLDRVRGIVAER